jgi:putative hydrolase of the HAD superfamily
MENIKIRWIVFDFGNVISLPQDKTSLRSMAIKLNLDLFDFEKNYFKYRFLYDRGDLSSKEYWQKVISENKIKLSEKQIKYLVKQDIKSWFRINKPILRWIKKLRKEGFKCAILSNMPKDHSLYFRRIKKLTQFFNFVIFSGEVNLCKPEPEIYELLINKLNVPAGSIAFLDDKEENVSQAIKSGLKSIVFNSNDNFENHIKKAEILINS